MRPPVVTLDLGLPPAPDDAVEGLRTLAEILAFSPETKVIVVTGNEERAHAVRAIALGAYDFYQKPIDGQVLSLIVRRAFNVFDLEAENRRLQQSREPSFQGIVTSSETMLALCRTVEKVAPTDISVLLLGESGTGKELFARALHNLSARRRGPFIAINCAAIPENLLESELFGHERGAFTGAVRQVKGKIESAQKGTLFLDEIGDMPMSLQVKLLRFIQERVIERVGGRETIPVDVRIVCATHQDLEGRIRTGGFREDLFYRIGEMALNIPPLRERDDDCVVLARHLIDKFSADHGRRRLQLAPDALAALRSHPWAGNVRELENRIKRAVILTEGQSITAAHMGLAAPIGSRSRKRRRHFRRRATRRSGRHCPAHWRCPPAIFPQRPRSWGSAARPSTACLSSTTSIRRHEQRGPLLKEDSHEPASARDIKVPALAGRSVPYRAGVWLYVRFYARSCRYPAVPELLQ